MYLCILDHAGSILLHRNFPAHPDAFLQAIAPYRDGLVVAAECMFAWYWIRPDGTMNLNPARLEARHDGQVRAALARGPVSLIVLGASHDLSASIRKLGDGTTEYLLVTTTSVERFWGKP